MVTTPPSSGSERSAPTPTQARARRSRLRVLEAATALFAEKGYEATGFAEIARRAEVSVGLACRYFPTKEHLALALYDRLATELAASVERMPDGTVGERFAFVVREKLALLTPHRRALVALVAHALDPRSRAAVVGLSAAGVRAKVAGIFAVVVAGATDAPSEEGRARVGELLYALHLALVLAWTQDASEDGRASAGLVDVAGEALAVFGPVVATGGLPMAGRVGELLRALLALPPTGARDRDRPRAILDVLMRRRRLLPGVAAPPSEAALALHLPRIEAFVQREAPLQLVLPAFPAKSPSPAKVLGKRPDMAEQLGLEALARVLDEIGDVYPPGAELVICSDGGVFADLVGVADADVARYRDTLEAMIAEVDPARVRFFGLEDALGPAKPAASRAMLVARYGSSVEALRERAAEAPSVAAMIDGIHRFLVDDLRGVDPTLSRSQAQKRARPLAYEVVVRSEAWGRLVAAAFPDAIRLSIHPQPDVSEKIGVHLVETGDAWLTPWHGVALREGERFRLVRRDEAEARGAVVVEEDGRPSYMEIPS
ncbi:MAG: L-tyrosine/L-tryptophan isonitrile synthase family protein [Sandaracinus sp.]